MTDPLVTRRRPHAPTARPRADWLDHARRALRLASLPIALLIALVSIWQLERARGGIEITALAVGTTPATLYRPAAGTGAEGAPLVVVAHGFAGSRQMMEAFSLTLARSGIAALAFDLRGHGRNPVPMSGDVASLDGVTARLVEEARDVQAAGGALEGVGPVVALLGHSMATDVIVRAAEAEGVPTVVAVSMYAEGVTAERPARLLVVSGAREGRLREVALEVARQVSPDAREGGTVQAGGVARRIVSIPGVGHVGVLWSPMALTEARDWIAAGAGLPVGGPVAMTGRWIAALLGAILVLCWPLARALPLTRDALKAPNGREESAGLGPRRLATVLALPALAGAAAALAVPSTAIGLRGVDGLAAFLFLLGTMQLLLLRRWGVPLGRPDALASTAFLAWAAVFAWALDRYGAAFVPTGPRWSLLALLLPGAVLAMVADGALTRGAPLWRMALIRAVPLSALLAAMLAAPTRLGLQFTALPVLILFWALFGTMAGRVAARRTKGAARASLGLVLAWSLAASLPLFA